MKWALVIKGWAYRVLGGQGVGLQGPRVSRGGRTGPRGQGVGEQGPGGQGVGKKGPKGSRGGVRCPIGSTAIFDVSSEMLLERQWRRS